MVHSLALLSLGVVTMLSNEPSRLFIQGAQFSATGFTLGLALFSGGLYIYSVSSITWFALLAPVGGLAFIVGWMGLAVAAQQLKTND